MKTSLQFFAIVLFLTSLILLLKDIKAELIEANKSLAALKSTCTPTKEGDLSTHVLRDGKIECSLMRKEGHARKIIVERHVQ